MNKVIDTDLPGDDPDGRIVGIAMWKFYPLQRTEDELDAESKEREQEGFPPGFNEALAKEFLGDVAKFKREIMGGKPHVLLNMLATRPAYHRRGIGAMQVLWGLEQADELGLPTYLEASPMGKPLYLRLGFEEVRPLPFDARKWGHCRALQHTILIRPVPTSKKADDES